MSVLREVFSGPDVVDIIAATAMVTGQAQRDIVGPRRFKPISNARKIVYVLGVRHGHSTTNIGRRVGVDHSSVVFGRQVAENFIARDPAFARLVTDADALAAKLAADRRKRIAMTVPASLREAVAA